MVHGILNKFQSVSITNFKMFKDDALVFWYLTLNMLLLTQHPQFSLDTLTIKESLIGQTCVSTLKSWSTYAIIWKNWSPKKPCKVQHLIMEKINHHSPLDFTKNRYENFHLFKNYCYVCKTIQSKYNLKILE